MLQFCPTILQRSLDLDLQFESASEVCHVRDGHVEDILIRASSACESHSMWLSSADRFEQEVFQNKIRQRRKRAASEGSSEGF